jgi:hypothetical protein
MEYTRPGKLLHNELERFTMLCSWVNHGKSTISMAMFKKAMCDSLGPVFFQVGYV